MYSMTLKLHVDKKLAQELANNPKLDRETRLQELSRQYGVCGNRENPDWRNERVNLDCGSPAGKLVIIAITDMVKGIIGLILGISLLTVLSIRMAQQRNFLQLKKDLQGTGFSYILNYSDTKWGLFVVLTTLILWHLGLLIFGKILMDAARQKHLKNLLRYYTYTLFTTVLFVLPYIRLIFVFIYCDPCAQSHLDRYFWTFTVIFYSFSFMTSIYVMTVLHSQCQAISSQPHSHQRQIVLDAQ